MSKEKQLKIIVRRVSLFADTMTSLRNKKQFIIHMEQMVELLELDVVDFYMQLGEIELKKTLF